MVQLRGRFGPFGRRGPKPAQGLPGRHFRPLTMLRDRRGSDPGDPFSVLGRSLKNPFVGVTIQMLVQKS
jgi:hypothetical protein